MKRHTSLREWLRHLAATDRLATLRPGVALEHELAAIAKRLDGVQATLFPAPAAIRSRSSRASCRSGRGSPRRWASPNRSC